MRGNSTYTNVVDWHCMVRSIFGATVDNDPYSYAMSYDSMRCNWYSLLIFKYTYADTASRIEISL